MTEITAETTIWFPGIYDGREGDYAKTASQIINEGGREKLIELVQERAKQDGEWAIDTDHVGDNEDGMRKMMAWVSDPKNIIQCYEYHLDYNPTVDWICRNLANGSKWVSGSRD